LIAECGSLQTKIYEWLSASHKQNSLNNTVDEELQTGNSYDFPPGNGREKGAINNKEGSKKDIVCHSL
jgi:hypothetical protein